MAQGSGTGSTSVAGPRRRRSRPSILRSPAGTCKAAWAITGEHHAWTNANGGFVGIRPARTFDPKRGDWGAWELAARYSELTLNDRDGVAGAATPTGGIRGGEQKISTLGLNWYPNNVVRFLLDYQWTRVDRLNAAGASIGEDVNVVSFRSQFAF